MIVKNSSGPLVAVSFDTALFQDLRELCARDGYAVTRMDPDLFLQQDQIHACFINLVTLDMDLRRRVSGHLDQHKFQRFSMIHDYNVTLGRVDTGCFLCPLVGTASESVLERDVICMGHSLIGHKTKISQGTIMSPGVVISGSVQVGHFCYLHTGVTILDKLSIADDVSVLAGSMVRKSINEMGRYLVNSKGVLKRI